MHKNRKARDICRYPDDKKDEESGKKEGNKEDKGKKNLKMGRETFRSIDR